MSLLLLNEDELRQTINLTEAITVIESAFVASAEGRIHIPGSFDLNLPGVQGMVDVKGAYLEDAPFFVIKIGSHFMQNPRINLPQDSGLITVFDAATGFPAALLLDNGYLTNVRAGIVGALATEYLANKQAESVAVIGAGRQAFIQIKSLIAVRSIKQVKVWGTTPLEADTFARRLVEDHNINIEIAPSVEAAVTNAGIVITATAGKQPLVQADWLKPGTHITAAGSTSLEKQELHSNVLQRADVIVVDNFEQGTTRGEIHHGLEAGVIGKEDIQGELSSLILGKIPGRTQADQITLIDLTGLEWQDAVVATLALDKALFLGLGQRLEPGIEQKNIGQRASILL